MYLRTYLLLELVTSPPLYSASTPWRSRFFSPKLHGHHQVSKLYNFGHFFYPYNPIENLALFGLDPLPQIANHIFNSYCLCLPVQQWLALAMTMTRNKNSNKSTAQTTARVPPNECRHQINMAPPIITYHEARRLSATLVYFINNTSLTTIWPQLYCTATEEALILYLSGGNFPVNITYKQVGIYHTTPLVPPRRNHDVLLPPPPHHTRPNTQRRH
jgi:hypothetical protein